MWKIFIPILCVVLLVLMEMGCATQIAPKGGPKDEQAPQLDTTNSTPNLQTNFEKKRIELSFDEWIQLNDVFNQVVVSPPLDKRPEIILRGRTVRFEFDKEEVLKEKTTYTINFGESVKDLTEGNVAESLRYVFSTGDYIDSLEVRGRVIDAYTSKPSEGVLVMLYENLADSVVRKERPFYFAKTDKQGSFHIQNVKESQFKVFALVDQNYNYLFDLENEQIAFLDEPITLNDSSNINLKLKLFEETKTLKLMSEEKDEYGMVKLFFNREPKDIDLSYQDVGQTVVYDYDKDTVRVWYHNPEDQAWQLYVQKDTTLFDTISIAALDRAAFEEAAQLSLKGVIPPTHNPSRAVAIGFNHPLEQLDTSLISVYEDSIGIRRSGTASIEKLNKKELQVNFPWKEAKNYILELLPGAVKDIYGDNNDTIIHAFIVNPLKNYGNMKIVVEGLVAKESYVLQLLGVNDLLQEEMFIQGDTTFSKDFTAMLVGSYKFILVEDTNGNKRWDPGNYDRKEQAEKIYIKQTDKLRANWDLEVFMKIE